MERKGYRGYIVSRPFLGERAPQHVQNLVIRDYCQRHGLVYLLSATEHTMPGCFMALEGILGDLPRLNGIVLYSLFTLPADLQRRNAICRRILDSGASLHGALEDFPVTNEDDLRRLDDLWLVRPFLQSTGIHG